MAPLPPLAVLVGSHTIRPIPMTRRDLDPHYIGAVRLERQIIRLELAARNPELKLRGHRNPGRESQAEILLVPLAVPCTPVVDERFGVESLHVFPAAQKDIRYHNVRGWNRRNNHAVPASLVLIVGEWAVAEN